MADSNTTRRTLERALLITAAVLAFVSALFNLVNGVQLNQLFASVLLVVSAAGTWKSMPATARWSCGFILTVVSTVAAYILLQPLAPGSDPEVAAHGVHYWLLAISAWLLAWAAVEQFASVKTLSKTLTLFLQLLIPVLFGSWLLLGWELTTRGLDVPQVLLPAPSVIAERFAASTHILWADFKQTFLKAVLIGYAMGCGAGFLVALAIDRSPFLQRGLLPIGNLVSALPIVGVAPIMVMWFGFDWPSKAAVVIVMTFFPMLVNTVAGLSASSAMQRDLMQTYAASYWQSLLKLRLPEALPFIFNALKINSTLALIGAIVAEFFGTPIVGMGFRISTEVGRMNVDMVWAEIAVAAVAGSLFYGVLALTERLFTFWHPSMRQ
jgi:NitT/TauT family transport system permease protein